MANFHNSSAHSQSSSSSNSQNWVSNATSSLRHNAGYRLAGIFITASALTGFGIHFNTNDAKASQGSKSSSQEQKQEEKSSAKTEAKIESKVESDSQSGGVSTSVSSTTDQNGQTSNEVTVNGQKVDVPASGSTSKVVQTPNGQVNVQVNNSNSGSSYTSSNSYTSSSSFSSSNNNNQTNSSFSSNMTTSW